MKRKKAFAVTNIRFILVKNLAKSEAHLAEVVNGHRVSFSLCPAHKPPRVLKLWSHKLSSLLLMLIFLEVAVFHVDLPE